VAKLRHVVEQAVGLGEKSKRCGAWHIVFLGLRNRLVDDLGRALERGIQECLVGLELLPSIDRAAAGCDCKQQKNTCKSCPETVASVTCAFRALHNLVEAETQEPSDYLLLGDLLAVAFRTDVGRNRFFSIVGNLSIRPDLEAQRWRETFARGIAGLAFDSHRDHAPGAA